MSDSHFINKEANLNVNQTKPKKLLLASEKSVTCKKCNSTDIVLSSSKFGEPLIKFLLPLQTNRCCNCYHRFWTLNLSLLKKPQFLIIIPVICIIIFYMTP